MGISFAFVFLTSWAEREALISMVLISEIRTSSCSSRVAAFFLALEVISDWHWFLLVAAAHLPSIASRKRPLVVHRHCMHPAVCIGEPGRSLAEE